MSFIETLFRDKAKKEVLFPRTKIKAVSDDNGKGLDAILAEMKVQVPENVACVNDILPDPEVVPINADTLGGLSKDQFAKMNDLNLKMNLLWENAAKTTDFPASELKINWKEYQIIIISFIRYPSLSTTEMPITVVPKENSTFLFQQVYSQSYFYEITRAFTFTATGINFGNGTYNGGASPSYCIPQRVYGIK